MRFIILAIALALLICGAEAKYSPALEMGGNITGNGYSLLAMKLGNSLPSVTVGPNDKDDFKTDGIADQAEVNAAFLISKHVILDGNLTTSSTINVPRNGTLESYGNYYIRAANSFSGHIITITGEHATVEGVKIDGNKANNNAAIFGIYDNNYDYLDVERCLFKNIPNRGIQVLYADKLKIRDNTFLNTGLTTQDWCWAIGVSTSTQSTISGNTIDGVLWLSANSGGFGIFTENCFDITIHDNTVLNASDYIYVENIDRSTISDNHIIISTTWNTDGGIKTGIDLGNAACDLTTVTGNTVSGSTNCYAYYCEGAHNCIWTGNTVQGCTYGFYANLAANNCFQVNAITGNVLSGAWSGGVGVTATSGSDITGIVSNAISGNTIAGYAIGVQLGTGGGGSIKGTTITGNSMVSAGTNGILTWGSVDYTTDLGNSYYSCGANSLSGAHNQVGYATSYS